jgi:hypothetical protein
VVGIRLGQGRLDSRQNDRERRSASDLDLWPAKAAIRLPECSHYLG